MYVRIKFTMPIFTRKYFVANSELYDLEATMAMVDSYFDDDPTHTECAFLDLILAELMDLKYIAVIDPDMLLPDLCDFDSYIHLSDWMRSYGIQGTYGREIDPEIDMEQDLPEVEVEIVDLAEVTLSSDSDSDSERGEVVATAVADILLRWREE